MFLSLYFYYLSVPQLMFIASDVRIAGNLMTGEIPTELGNLVSLINLDMRKFYNDSNYHLRSLQIFIYLTIN